MGGEDLDEILNLIESVSEGFPSYSFRQTRDVAITPPSVSWSLSKSIEIQ